MCAVIYLRRIGDQTWESSEDQERWTALGIFSSVDALEELRHRYPRDLIAVTSGLSIPELAPETD